MTISTAKTPSSLPPQVVSITRSGFIARMLRKIAAIGTMHRHPFATRDEADNGIRWHRLAATRQLRQQAPHADDQNALLGVVAWPQPGHRQLGEIVFVQRRLAATHRQLQLAHVQLGPRNGNEQVVRAGKAEPVRELVETDARLPHALQLASHHRPPLGEHVLERQIGKPLPDLGARAMVNT
jgi:hypothetical protein